MFIRSEHTRISAVEYDVCIVGAGPAGISLAVELSAASKRICLLEAGGLGYDGFRQQFLGGSAVGDRYPLLRDTRYAGFGGTTNVWAGWCRPLEASDFAISLRKEGATDWPFGPSELLPFYRRAHALGGLGEFAYDPDHWRGRLDLFDLGANDSVVANRIFHVDAGSFGARYLETLQRADNVDVFLQSRATQLLLDADGTQVIGIEASGAQGPLVVRGRRYVLAAGGIENARLLLLADTPAERSSFNRNDLVGRYFTDHAFVDFGKLIMNDPGRKPDYHSPRTFETGGRTATIRAALSLTDAVVAEHRTSNAAVFFHPPYACHAVFRRTDVKAMLLAWDKLRGRAVPGHGGRLLLRAARAPHAVALALARKLLVEDGPVGEWHLRGMFETESRHDNRVILDRATDPGGSPLARVEWSLGERDIADMRRVVAILGAALERAGIGRVVLRFPDEPSAWRQAVEAGKHHMGTTRMHRDPARGVVDENCRVHGVDNLFVAGSSVFPSGGYANPTLTIVALAARLAQHLEAQT